MLFLLQEGKEDHIICPWMGSQANLWPEIQYLLTSVTHKLLCSRLEEISISICPHAEERKAALRKLPEQMILSEVRRMVEEMQAVNKKLEETEAAIEEYFKPIDKEAEYIMKMQLEGEEKTMKEMMNAMQRQAMLEKAEAEKIMKTHNADASEHVKEKSSATITPV